MAASRAQQSQRPTETARVPFNPVVRIRVDRLFGRYSYDIGTEERTTDRTNSHGLILLYGDNGSGKTAILRLLFHLLSPKDLRGHRTEVSKTPFRSFRVTLADGTQIGASRPAPDLVGSFRWTFKRKGQEALNFVVVADEDLVVRGRRDQKPPPDEQAMYDAISGLDLESYFLTDDRELISDQIPEADPTRLIRSKLTAIQLQHAEIESVISADSEDLRAHELAATLRRVHDWVRDQVITGAARGGTNANAIYADLISRITREEEQEKRRRPRLESLRNRLESVRDRSLEFEQFGLVPPLNASPILEAIEAARGSDSGRLVARILEPFLDGLEARLDALDSIQSLMKSYVETINSFYSNKRLTFDLSTGVRVFVDDSQLAPGQLSSGERQLLLVFSHLVYARNRPTLFIVDEPELSLNVKWQRTVLRSLLRFAGDSPIQFVLATHSIELITSHRANVSRLDPGIQLAR